MTNKSFRDYINLIENTQHERVAEAKNHNGVDISNIEPGDKITWWYNKFHPNYEGIVRRVEGKYLVVYATGAGQLYKIEKSDIRSLKKSVAEEQLEETSPEAIAKINQITRN